MPSGPELARWLADSGAYIKTGPFTIRVRTSVGAAIDGITTLYEGYPTQREAPFADFHVELTRTGGVRRWIRRQVNFEFDGERPFRPLPLEQALPMFEWGLNAVISQNAHQYLIVHAAAVARDGLAAILPGPPGSGKSTLCAALVNRGWRLLTDELALFSLETGDLFGLARPINLKNESIDIMRRYVSGSVFSQPTHDTVKGTVALMKAPADSVAQVDKPARPAWVIVPKFARGAACELTPRSRAETLIELGSNAFNYSIHGRRGFHLLGDVIENCACYNFRYSNLDDAIATFRDLEVPAAQRDRVA